MNSMKQLIHQSLESQQVSRRIIKLTFATICAVLLGLGMASAQISQYLPFDPLSTSELRASPKKVFAHYFTPYPVSIDNKDPSIDYYTTGYLNPAGEGGIHSGYGGYLRQRPLGRGARPETNWEALDMELEVRRAIDVGIDGFTVDLLSTTGTHLTRTKRMLDAAHAVDTGFKIVLMPDMEAITDSTALANLIQTLAAYPACYRLSDGRLVVSPFNGQNQTPTWWQSWIATMSSRGISVAFVPVFQNWRAYASSYKSISYGYSDWGDRTAANNTGASWVNAATDAHTYVPVWMHPVAPQDSRPRSQRYWEAQNTGNFRNTWELGAIGKADWVQLVTWNDYSEGAEISPSTGIQHLFYDLTAYYVHWFKKGVTPSIVRDCIYYSHRQHSSTASPDLTKQTAGAFTIASGSPVNEIEAYVFLTANATLEIQINGVTTQHPVTAPRAVVKVPLQQGQPIFRLIRNSQVVAAVQSPFPINNTITYQDFLYHGGTSLRAPVPQVSQAYWPRNPTLPPGTPGGLVATPGNAQVTLTWNAVSGATSYKVKRATTSGGPYTTVATPTSASTVNSGLNNGTTYYYVVSAVNAGGESANSSQVSATPIAPALPDLIVTAITWSPASPVTGQAVTFSATIKNQGTVATPAGVIHGVSFSVDGTQVNWSDTSTTSLAAGASRTVTANSGPSGSSTWTSTTGTHSVVATVDDINRMAESNESNNTFTNSMTVAVGPPDLIVTAITWSPASPVAGEAVTFTATIKNQGTGPSPGGIIHGVSFWVDGAQVNWSDTSTTSLAAGATRALTANSGPTGSSTWTATTGTHSIRAFVDDVNRIAESDENNNNFTNSMTVLTLPSPWQSADVGSVGVAGSASYSGGTFTVNSSGADIWGTADAFRYVYQTSSGDCSIVARVATIENTDPWAKSGVMIREATTAGAINASIFVSSANGITFQWRTSTGASSLNSAVTGIAAPYWVKLTRTANSFAAFRSPDGTTWTQVGTAQTLGMTTSATIGLAVTSHNNTNLCTSTLSNVTGTP